MKKICVITGTRAEYGQLRLIMQLLKNSKAFKLQTLVTGSHLSYEFGNTIDEILKDKFHVDQKVEMLVSSNTSIGISKSVGLGMISFSDALNYLQPNAVLLLGDRFEIFSAASAAMIQKIPIIHLHGGEITVGSIDDTFRHLITKMSHIHFASTETYKNRIIQLGENQKYVHNVGSLGVDNLKNTNLLKKSEVEKILKMKFGPKSLLITMHPETQNNEKQNLQNIKELLKSLQKFKHVKLIFTLPNSDINSQIISLEIKNFIKKNKNAFLFESLGYLLYFSCIKYVDAVVGNSSSGILEVPSLKKITINIGNRQEGRIMAKSIINCEVNERSITTIIRNCLDKKYETLLKNLKNPYGEGGASKKILSILKKISFDGMYNKKFYDIE